MLAAGAPARPADDGAAAPVLAVGDVVRLRESYAGPPGALRGDDVGRLEESEAGARWRVRRLAVDETRHSWWYQPAALQAPLDAGAAGHREFDLVRLAPGFETVSDAAGGPLQPSDVGVVVEVVHNGVALSVKRLLPEEAGGGGGVCESSYDAEALEAATRFPGAGGAFGEGALVRLAHGYSAYDDAESGPLTFADVGMVTSTGGRSPVRVTRLLLAAREVLMVAPLAHCALRLATPPPDRAAPPPPLQEGDLVRLSAAAMARATGTGAVLRGHERAVFVVVAPPPDAVVGEGLAETPLYLQLLTREVTGWSYATGALEVASRLEAGRVACEAPVPPALRAGQYVRLADGVTSRSGARARELAGERHEDDGDDAADSEATAWLRPGELALVRRVRGRRAPVSARRVGDIRTAAYAPGALVPADAPPPALAVGDRVVLCPEYAGALPSQARGPRLEREHVGVVLSHSGGINHRSFRLRVAAPDGSVRTYRGAALERAQLPRQHALEPQPQPRCVLLPCHGHPVGARTHIWPLMNRYHGGCDLCGQSCMRSTAARCTAGCGFDICVQCLRGLVVALPGSDAAAALSGDDVSAEQLLQALPADAAYAAPSPPLPQSAAQPALPGPSFAAAAPPRPASGSAWSFIDGPASSGGAAAEQDASAIAVATLRSRIAAYALHGVLSQFEEEEDEPVGDAARMELDNSDAESEQELESEGEADGEEATHKVLRVYRDALVESSMAAMGPIGGDSWRRPTLVTFCATAGGPREEGVDGGGLTREWYAVTARALMELPVICPTDNDAREFWFNPARSSPSDLAQCSFLGAFLGRALLDGSVRTRASRLRHVTLGGVRLCDTFYKVLLGLPLTLADVADVSAADYRSLRAIHDSTVTPAMCLGAFEHRVFAPDAPPGAQPVAVLPLRPGGSYTPVTNANKEEFVLLKAQSILMTSVARQLEAACAGFFSLVPPSALRASKLSPRQLRRLLCGGGDGFDVDELRRLTQHAAPYSADAPPAAWLWEVLAEAGRACQSDFLEFATGASDPPSGGFAAIRGGVAGATLPPLVIGPAPLRADGAADDAPPRLPTARTCANLFELPPYESKAQLRDKLREALAHKNSFGFV